MVPVADAVGEEPEVERSRLPRPVDTDVALERKLSLLLLLARAPSLVKLRASEAPPFAVLVLWIMLLL